MSRTNNLLIHKHPELLNEYDYEKNNANHVNVNMLTCGSNKKIWWRCRAHNHSFETTVKHRINGQGCPYCSGHKVLTGFNDLQSQYPELVSSEWDYEHNDANNIKPDEITAHSNKKAWWKCNTCKGSYQMPVYLRTSYSLKCPYCSGHKILKGYNDLQSCYSELIESEWDWIENDKQGLKPDEITTGSGVKASWHCTTCNGYYKMQVYNKTNGQSCPYCAGKKILKGYNDLATVRPDLLKQWDYASNNAHKIYPDEITVHSDRKASWWCNACHGKYNMSVSNKTAGQGCPFCAGAQVLKGYNDLASCYPDLINSEWDWIRNNLIGLKPDEITCRSDRKAYWKCSECKHEWFTRISHRTRENSGCPACACRISKQENQVADFISDYICLHMNMKFTMLRSIKFKRIYDNLNIDYENALSDALQAHLLKELDIYIPELGFAMEYDGDYWHDDERMMERCGLTNDEAHRIKQELCKKAGIDLIFITEHDWLNDNAHVKMRIINEITNKNL